MSERDEPVEEATPRRRLLLAPNPDKDGTTRTGHYADLKGVCWDSDGVAWFADLWEHHGPRGVFYEGHWTKRKFDRPRREAYADNELVLAETSAGHIERVPYRTALNFGWKVKGRAK